MPASTTVESIRAARTTKRRLILDRLSLATNHATEIRHRRRKPGYGNRHLNGYGAIRDVVSRRRLP